MTLIGCSVEEGLGHIWPLSFVLMAVAYKGKTVKQWLMDLARMRLAEMEKKGLLPKGK